MEVERLKSLSKSAISPTKTSRWFREFSKVGNEKPLVLWGFFRQDLQDLQDYGGVDNRNPDNPVNPVEKEIPDIGFRVLKLDSSSLRDTSGTFKGGRKLHVRERRDVEPAFGVFLHSLHTTVVE